MVQQYLKQAWRTMRDNPILSAISIIATALAIAMMMVLVMTDRVKTSNFPPEVNRDRTLFVWRVSCYEAGRDNRTISSMGLKVYKEILGKMETPEAVALASGFYRGSKASTLDSKSDKIDGMLRKADLNYFKCYVYKFLYGEGFEEGDIESGLKKVILSEAFARKLFGRANVVGETVVIDYQPYDVIGVMSTPSNLFRMSYSDMWVPYTATNSQDLEFPEETGEYVGIILAKESRDFPKIRAELESLVAQYNGSQKDVEVILNNENHLMSWREVTQYTEYFGNPEKEAENRRNTIAFVLLFLFVPAINLATLTFSRHEQKLSEMGIRRSYGASRGSILNQVMTESLLYTLIGGLLGFLLSIVAVYAMRNLLFLDFLGSNFEMSIWQLLNVGSFLIALLICLVLNLLSSIIPAWLMSRKDIIDALNRR